ncbi:unnamed protein product [Symbiodinium necroappetens]|uniref:Uncharacterized protein n=1 Tax=Symbiodinium necroappetens TaxID=1628268 RepID=A0A813BEL4_9DINO|nr:unnamed protein product [Symbiodinium necroappetens]
MRDLRAVDIAIGYHVVSLNLDLSDWLMQAAAKQQEALQEELDEGADEMMIRAEEPVLLASVPDHTDTSHFPLESFRDRGTAALTSWIESYVLQHRKQRQQQQPPAEETQEEDPQGLNDSNVLQRIMQNSSHLYSKLCLGHAVGLSRTSICRSLKRCASALLHGQRILWSRLLHRIGTQLRAGECEGLLIARMRKYDESPFCLRIDESGEVVGLDRRRSRSRGQQQQTESAGSRAKLVSSFHRLFMVLRRPCKDEDGKFIYQALTGSLPHRLHVVETVSAQNMKASQDACIADLPIPEDFTSLFKMRLMLSCTDRHSSNLSVEKKLQEEHESWTFAQSHCTMHKAADAQSRQFELSSAHVSGMLSASISMQAAGTHGQLKAILNQIFEERLVVLHGNLQLREHRHSLYELLLPLSGPEKLRHAKQRCILDALFNGNVQDQGRIIHMTTNPSCNRDTMLLLFCSFGAWGLLGGSAAPFFNRSKWLGGEVAVSWHALLANTHGLHQELFQRWSAVAKPTPSCHVTPGSSSAGWSAVASRIVASSILDGPADAAAAAAATAAAAAAVPVTEETDEVFDGVAGMGAAADEGAKDATTLDWGAWNRANKRKAIVWSLCNPGTVLLVMRVSMQPVINLLHALFRLSADKFQKDQLLASVRGEDRKFRLTELFFGELLPEFHRDMNTAYQSAMKALPFQGMTTAIRGLATRMLTRAYASLHQTLFCNRASSLVMLFKVLVSGSEKDAAALAFANLKECLLDDISKSFRSCFADPEAVASEEASAMLECIAREYDIDTLQVERGFSQIRRRVMAKSVQTWRPSPADVASECLMRHCALDKQRQEYFMGRRSSVTARLAKPRQSKGPTMQGGGPWRAFMRIRSQGRKFTGLQSTQLAKEYRHLQHNDPEAFAVLENLGHLAHARVVQDAQQWQQNAGQSTQPRRPAFDFEVSQLPKSVLESLGVPDDDADDPNFRAAASAEVPAILGVEDELRRLVQQSRQAAIEANALENALGAEICAKSAEVAATPHFRSLNTPHTSQTDAEKALLLASSSPDFLCVPGQPAVAVFSPTAPAVVKDTARSRAVDSEVKWLND